MAALKRTKRELLEFNKDPPETITAGPISDNDFFHWKSTIIGPEDSPYEGGIFHLNVTYPTDYPLKPLKCIFTTKLSS